MNKAVTDFLKGDKVVWMIYFFLCMISLVEVYSASSNLTYTSGNHWDPMINQAGFLLAGLVVILIVHRIPCKLFMLFPFFLLPFAVLLLLYTAIFGGSINGASRWMNLGFIQFQPSEIGKAALIMSVAVVLAKTQGELKTVVNGKTKIITGAVKGGRTMAFKIIMCMACLICLLIVPENFSTAAMLFVGVMVMMFIGRVPMDLLAKTTALIVAFLAVASVAVMNIDDATLNNIPKGHRITTWKNRIITRISHSEATDSVSAYNLADNLQVAHAHMAVANSNIIGRGTGNSVERDFLSHAESDFIYSIIIEETGIWGGLFVIFLYVTLLVRAGRIANKCQRFFPAYLVLGFAIMMILQAVVNMGVAVGLFPVTGQPLPLISKGGSSIMVNCFYIGVILSVSRYADKVSETKEEPAELKAEHETQEYYSQENMA